MVNGASLESEAGYYLVPRGEAHKMMEPTLHLVEDWLVSLFQHFLRHIRIKIKKNEVGVQS